MANIFDQFDPAPAVVDHEAAQAATRAFPKAAAPAGHLSDDQLLAAPGPSRLPPPPEAGTLTSAGFLPPLPPGARLDQPPPGFTPDAAQQHGGYTDAQLLAQLGPDPRQPPPGYTLDPVQPARLPPLPAGATLDKLPPPPEAGTLTASGRQTNPFDRFDGQPAAAQQPNYFARFLPDGTVLDDGHPNSAGHWAGAITRGALDGLTGLADLTTAPLVRGANDLTRAAGYTPSQTMIALGKSGDDQLNRDLDGNHLNLPMAQTAGQRIAGGIAGAVAPTVATMGLGEGLGAVAGAGRAAQAVRGVGQLLSGSKGLQIASSATGGAANVIGQEAGMSPEDAALLGIGASFIPGAGMALRAVAGNAARSAFVNSIAKTLTPEEAAQTMRAGTILDSYGGASSSTAQAAYGADLNAAAGSYRRAAQAAGYVDPEDGRAISQAATLANSRTAAPGAATAGVRALGLPADHQAALEGTLGQLQAVSALPSGAPVGPMSSLVARAAPYVAGLSALGAAGHGDFLHAAELAGGAIAGRTIASPALRLAGTVGDRLSRHVDEPHRGPFGGCAADRWADRHGHIWEPIGGFAGRYRGRSDPSWASAECQRSGCGAGAWKEPGRHRRQLDGEAAHQRREEGQLGRADHGGCFAQCEDTTGLVRGHGRSLRQPGGRGSDHPDAKRSRPSRTGTSAGDITHSSTVRKPVRSRYRGPTGSAGRDAAGAGCRGFRESPGAVCGHVA